MNNKYAEIDEKLSKQDIPIGDLIAYFRVKCASCGHHRIMHDKDGKCEGVMNKPCTSGCDKFKPEL